MGACKQKFRAHACSNIQHFASSFGCAALRIPESASNSCSGWLRELSESEMKGILRIYWCYPLHFTVGKLRSKEGMLLA